LTPVAGRRTTFGSPLFKDHIPQSEPTIVKRIRNAGAIIIGKTNTPEFGHKGTTDNLLVGPTKNPWDPSRTAGGSSGGSAAAVASKCVPLAEGSDG
ncbi:amidase family protein, partial [Planococcus sp. SIMBA_143]